ncbi:MAG TPA: protein-disulfide reductase DsbD domain-containing protein [Ohtaekwangia sp.]|nr:protein-disulfide reductase DsbD domain-containing protein [Ohtaekwangia sp.]
MILLKFTALFLAGYTTSPVEITKDQAGPPVMWTFSAERISRTEVMLTLHATLGKGWHLYAQNIDDGGPIPTQISVAMSDNYSAVGRADEKGTAVKFRDEFYDMDITWYQDDVSFLQRVSVFQPVDAIRGTIQYMICNDHLCIPGRQDFNIGIKALW